MALYDDAKFIFLASAAAGLETKDASKVYNVKPAPVVSSGGAVAMAFETVYGSFGKYFVFLAMFIFVFTTSTGWYSYYETLLIHLFKKKPRKTIIKAVKSLQIILPLPTFVLAAAGIIFGVVPKYFWLLGDVSSGLSVYANLITLIALSPVIFKLVREFETKYLPYNKKSK